MNITHTCPECGSTDIAADARAEWDPMARIWVLANVFDACVCHDCDAEFDITSAYHEDGE